MIGKIINCAFAIALVFGFSYLVRVTEKPWPLVEGQPLVWQVGACQLINLGTFADNYLEALNILGMRPDFETGVNLAVNGPPRFGRRYDCFANLSENEKVKVIETKEYADIQFELQRQIIKFTDPHGGF